MDAVIDAALRAVNEQLTSVHGNAQTEDLMRVTFLNSLALIYRLLRCKIQRKALLLSSSLLFLAGNAISDETSSAQPIVKPFALEKSFFEGKGLTKGDHAVFEGEGLSRITAPVPFSLHEFHIGKITVSIYESEPDKARIDGMPFDEFV